MSDIEIESEEERRFKLLLRISRLYRGRMLDDLGLIHFLAGYCGFVPKDKNFTEYLDIDILKEGIK